MQYTVNLAFVKELGVLGLDALKLDGHFLSGCHIRPQVNVSERTATDLAAEAVLLSDAELHFI